jgi:uncharacterized protein YbbK (DUF523 family)
VALSASRSDPGLARTVTQVREDSSDDLRGVFLVSACLLGMPTVYDGRSHPQPGLIRLAARGCIIPICPEIAGGLGTPRPTAEIVGGSGEDVLDGRARVLTVSGEDVTEAYVRGAERTWAVARQYNVTAAILRQRSPSCGSDRIYDGTHTGRLMPGQGVTAALLRRHGVTVCSERKPSLHQLPG